MTIENLNRFLEDMEYASRLGKDIEIKDYNKIVFCGIGGSAYPGEAVESLNLKIPVFVMKEELPEFVNKKTLCFIVSYSGNTEETFDLYKQAKNKRCKIVIITSNGKLSLAPEKKVLIPKNYLPREAFIFLLFPVLNILKINYKKCFEVIKNFDLIECRRVADALKEKIPVVYCSSENLKSICYRWQTFFNENSKIFGHSNYFPELAHNEIEADVDNKFRRILLFDKKTRQIERAAKFFKPIEVQLKGKTLIARIVFGTYFGFLVSYYLAESEGVDYREIRKIRELKG